MEALDRRAVAGAVKRRAHREDLVRRQPAVEDTAIDDPAERVEDGAMARLEIDAIGPKAGRRNLVTAVIETPAGSRNKFVYDGDLGFFRLHKILPMGSAFPFDFGFIPGTLAEDGDPLDLLVLGEEATFTGCAVTVRLLGVMQALQTDDRRTIRNDRLIGTPEGEKIKPAALSIDEVPGRVLDQIEHFFIAYNRYEGREFKIVKRRGPGAALKLLEQARRKYMDAQTKRQAGISARQGLSS